jgi:hypothetical protein
MIGVLVHANTTPGKLLSVQTAEARARGARVITGQHLLDLDPYIGPVVRDQPLLAIDRVRYAGEPVALVLAESRAAAEAAARFVTADVAPLPPAITGAPVGQPALVHLTEMLRRGPLADEIALDPARTNRLIDLQMRHLQRSAGRDDWQGTMTHPGSASTTNAPLIARAALRGSTARVDSASSDPNTAAAQLAQLVEPVGLSVDWFPGESRSEIGVQIDALALAAARVLNGAVEVHANSLDFGWQMPRFTLTVAGGTAELVIDAGASSGYLPAMINDMQTLLERRYPLGELTIAIDYSESAPLAATLDDWRTALAKP